MSEEKPNFKVTDRRLFNSDGSPREGVVREEQKPEEDVPAAVAPPPARPESARTGAGNQRAAESPSGAAASPARPSRGGDDARPELRDAEQPQPRQPQPGAAEADPTPFANLVMFIASPAAAAMGMTEHPGLAPGEIDLPLAKHCIDLLATVGEKTRGNLSAQEQQIVDGLLAELRMQYVSLTSTRPAAPPRGFTGGDITGGR